MRELYMKNGHGIVLVYPITSQSSFNELTDFRKQILRVKDTEKFPMVLVGTNCELEDDRQVSTQEGSSLALEWGIPFFEVSTRNPIDVDQVFFELAREIIRNNKRIEKYKTSNSGNTAFLIACGCGYIEDVKSMLKDKKVDVNETNNIGESPFYVAYLEGHLEIVKLLLNDKRVQINKGTNSGRTPLIIACSRGHIDVVKYILASEREINLNSKKNGATAIDIARESGNKNIVELLESFQKNPNLTRYQMLRSKGEKKKFFFFFF